MFTQPVKEFVAFMELEIHYRVHKDAIRNSNLTSYSPIYV
jgi:hypothetical protein